MYRVIAMYSCMNRGMYSLCVMTLSFLSGLLFSKRMFALFHGSSLFVSPGTLLSHHPIMKCRRDCIVTTKHVGMHQNHLHPCCHPVEKGGGDNNAWRLLHGLLLLHITHIQLLKQKILHGSGFFLSQYVESLIA